MRGLADRRTVGLGVCLAMLLLARAAFGQGEELAEHTCDTPVSAPDDIALHLSIEDTQRVFREGEIIPLQVSFASSAPDRYMVAVRLHDDQRPALETFCFAPASGSDPLADYYLPLIDGGDGPITSFSTPLLGGTPLQVQLNLNQWWTLPPGDYRMHIVSPRVTRAGDPVDHQVREPIIMRSNEVRFRVVKADAEWQAQQLAQAERVLDSRVVKQAQKWRAARVLRFLGTEQSIRELARRYQSVEQLSSDSDDEPDGSEPYHMPRDLESEYRFGLLGFPDHSRAFAAMHEQMSSSSHPITEAYLDTLADLETASQDKRSFSPEHIGDDDAQQAALAEYERVHQSKVDAGWAATVALAGRKTGRARALTISELLKSDSLVAKQSNPELRRMLIPIWADLPVEVLNNLLDSRWEQIGGPEWIPVLQKIAASTAADAKYSDHLDRGSAVLHLYELSPQEGRELILREIGEAPGDIGIDVLGRLPEKELPEFDAVLVQRLRLKHARQIDVDLLDRYATPAILNEARAEFELDIGRKALCGQEAAFLRYFLRVSPEYGAEQVKYVIEHPELTCGTFRFDQLKQYLRLPKVEQMALTQLEQASPSVAASISEALSRFGSANSEAALWNRLEQLHAKRRDQPGSELHPEASAMNSDADEQLEYALVHALTNGQAWCLDEKSLKRLKSLASPGALTNSVVGTAERTLATREFETRIGWWDYDAPAWSVGWYSGATVGFLEEKLAQLPAGSRLMLTVPPTLRDHTLEMSLRKTAAEHNLIIEDLPDNRNQP